MAVERAFGEGDPGMGTRVLHCIYGLTNPVETDRDPLHLDTQAAVGRNLIEASHAHEGQVGSPGSAVHESGARDARGARSMPEEAAALHARAGAAA